MSTLVIEEINKIECVKFVHEYHYSKVMPVLTKHYLGIYIPDGTLLGVLTLGWGTQPKATINKILPGMGFGTNHYYEIGKMCLSPQFNENTYGQYKGSMLVSAVIKWMKANTEKMFLYTLADGIVGKVGYVYQASNFYYGGYFWTDVYVGPDGEKIHPRTTKNLCKENSDWLGVDKKIFWLTHDFMEYKGIQRIKGKMFRYMYPLNRRATKILIRKKWHKQYPKDKDLQWKRLKTKGVYVPLEEMPTFALDVVNVNKANIVRNLS